MRKGHKVDALMIARADGDWRGSHSETIRIEFESLFDKPDRMARERFGNGVAKLRWQGFTNEATGGAPVIDTDFEIEQVLRESGIHKVPPET